MPRTRVIFILVTSLTVFSNFVFAGRKNPQEFYKYSTEVMIEAQTKKTFDEKRKILSNLETRMNETLNEYKKRNPKKGSPEEKEIALLKFTLRPAFDLTRKASITNQDCDYAQQTVIANDSMGRGENPPLTKPAKEALQWIDTLCTNK